MREIPLTQNKVALVDDDMFKFLSQWKWRTNQDGYAYRYESMGNRKTAKILMHREVLGVFNRNIQVDHINDNRSDNRVSNLRRCSKYQNNANRRSGTRRFKGIYKCNGRWRAKINPNRKQIHLGTFDTPEEAARAYNVAARKYYGDFARVNEA